jgi:hypothetical protein
MATSRARDLPGVTTNLWLVSLESPAATIVALPPDFQIVLGPSLASNYLRMNCLRDPSSSVPDLLWGEQLSSRMPDSMLVVGQEKLDVGDAQIEVV